MPTQKQSDKTFQEISQLIREHLEARDWQDNPTRGLAISLVLEASELLEHYQWRDTPVGSSEQVGEELADVFIYAFQIAQSLDINITDAVEKKLIKAGKKYPADSFKGKSDTERTAAWIDAKVNYTKEGL
jgi:NTP pyrophosphatase (non-canonical NTP hydrolase)